MKKYLVLLIAWAFASAFTFASGIDKGEKVLVKIEKGDLSKTVVVRLVNLERLTTEVTIQSTDGAVFFKEYIRREHGYATKFIMDGMPDGDYVLYIRNRYEMWAQTFSMNFRDITFFDTPTTKAYDGAVASLASFSDEKAKGKVNAYFRKTDDLKFKVLLTNLQQQPTEIKIVSLGIGAIYSSTVKNEYGYGEVMNMVDALSGDYIIYVHAADATVVQFFSISAENNLTLGESQRLDRPSTNIAVPHEDILSSN
jgi:hypothetical protein